MIKSIAKVVEVGELFVGDIVRELTINHISKELGKSYAYTNAHVRALLEEEILNKKIIGPSIVCSLNLNNEYARVMLKLAFLKKKEKFLDNNKQLRATIEKILEQLPLATPLMLKQNKLYTIGHCNLKGIQIVEPEEITAEFLKGTLLLSGYEGILLMLSQNEK